MNEESYLSAVNNRCSISSKSKCVACKAVTESVKYIRELQCALTAKDESIKDLEAKLAEACSCIDEEQYVENKMLRTIKELEADKLHLEEIETDQSNTIGFMEQGIIQWKAQCEDAESKVVKLEEELARHEWVSVEDIPKDFEIFKQIWVLCEACEEDGDEYPATVGLGMLDSHRRLVWSEFDTRHKPYYGISGATHYRLISLPDPTNGEEGSVKKVCEWKRNGLYHLTSCGHDYESNSECSITTHLTFCPYCRLEIREVE